MSDMRGMAVSYRGVSVGYGGQPILRKVSFEIARSGFTVLIGPNGCGKTTLLRATAQLLPPLAGHIVALSLAEDVDIYSSAVRARRKVRRATAVLSQSLDLVQGLSVLRNVQMGLLGRYGTYGAATAVASRNVTLECMDLLERFDLHRSAGRRVADLSRGERQRVALARVYTQRPELVLADEPIASTDPVNGRLMMECLSEMNKEWGTTVVCALHQLPAALEYGTCIIGLRSGKAVVLGSPMALKVSDLSRWYLGEVA